MEAEERLQVVPAARPRQRLEVRGNPVNETLVLSGNDFRRGRLESEGSSIPKECLKTFDGSNIFYEQA